MKRLDDGKVSLVDFMRSIEGLHRSRKNRESEVTRQFAHFNPQARPADTGSAEDCSLVRSAN